MLGSLCNGRWAKSSNSAFTGIYWKSHFRILQNQNYHVYKCQCTKGNTELAGKPFNVALLLNNVIFKWIDFWLVNYHLSSTAFYFQPFDKTRTHIHQQDITNTSTISKMFFNQKSLRQIALAYLCFFGYFISSLWYHYGLNPAVTIICTCNSHFWLCKIQWGCEVWCQKKGHQYFLES